MYIYCYRYFTHFKFQVLNFFLQSSPLLKLPTLFFTCFSNHAEYTILCVAFLLNNVRTLRVSLTATRAYTINSHYSSGNYDILRKET
jgi:hypothetical protein